jgi:ribonucleoside-diphosphate reductase alpha chain
METTKQSQTQPTYTTDEAYQASLQYFKGDDLAARVWVNKYALKDSYGAIFEATPNDMHRRIAKEIARIEKLYPNPLSEDEVFDLIKDFKYIIRSLHCPTVL